MVTFQLALSATRHIDPANLPQTVPTAVFWSLFTDSWAFLSVTLPKVGVAILLVRIFRPRPWVRATIMSMALGLFVVCIGGFIICFVQCNPVAGQWDPYQHPGTRCWPRNVQIDYSLLGSCKSSHTLPQTSLLTELRSYVRIFGLGFCDISGLRHFAFATAAVEKAQHHWPNEPGSSVSVRATLRCDD